MAEDVEYRKHDLDVSAIIVEGKEPKADIKARGFPDGSTSCRVTTDEMREIAEMILDAADEIDEIEEEIND